MYICLEPKKKKTTTHIGFVDSLLGWGALALLWLPRVGILVRGWTPLGCGALSQAHVFPRKLSHLQHWPGWTFPFARVPSPQPQHLRSSDLPFWLRADLLPVQAPSPEPHSLCYLRSSFSGAPLAILHVIMTYIHPFLFFLLLL